jgi:plasmid stability protein
MESKQISSVLVRLPENLKEQLKQRAAENCRSLTGEIIARLQESLKKEKVS